MNRACALALLLFCSPLLAPGQQPSGPTCGAGPEKIFQDELLDKLVGRWKLTGSMMRRELLQECAAEWVLNHEFLRLDCRETRQPPLLKAKYEATTYLGCSSTSQRYVAYVLDVFGAGESLGFGRRTGNDIELVWDYPDGAFQTTMTWKAESDSWMLLLRQKDSSGKWSTFAEKTLRRLGLPK